MDLSLPRQKKSESKLAGLAILTIGGAVSSFWTRIGLAEERRLLPHAQACSRWASIEWNTPSKISDKKKNPDSRYLQTLFYAACRLGDFYYVQSRLEEAERTYERILQGMKEVLGPKHPDTLDTANNLAIIYMYQGKLEEAERKCEWAPTS